jgi:hypothetical protein
MPNFDFKPDKVHLFIPTILASLFFLIAIIFNIFLILKKSAPYFSLLYIVILIVLFLFLVDFKSELQETGYLGMIVMSFFLIINLIKNRHALTSK